MTDPTKKDDSEKAKAVKNAMTGTPDTTAKPAPASKPAEPVKEPPKSDPPMSAAAKAAPAAAAKPPESVKEPPKPAYTQPAGAKPPSSGPAGAGFPPSDKSPPKEPAKGSVPSSSSSAGKPVAAAGGKEPPKSPSGPQGPGAPKGPGTPPSSATAKSPLPKKPEKKRGCLGTLIWLLVIVAALGAAAYYTWPHWPDVVKRPVEAKIDEIVPTIQMPEEKAAVEDRLAKNEQQISALESKVAELAGRKVLTEDDVKALTGSSEAPVGAADVDSAKVKALTARLDSIEQALTSAASSQPTGDSTETGASTGSTAATAVLGVSVQALSQRVKQLETDVATVSGVESRLADMEERALAAPSGEAKAAVVLAVSHLNHAVLQSKPFTTELDALKAVVGDNAALNEPIGVLEPLAAKGVPSIIELRASFPAVAREVSRVHADWTGEDWVDKALSRVTSLVSVRRTGEDAVADQGTDGAIAQAEAALVLGDVAAATKALEGLEGPSANAAAPWLAQAQERLSAEAALGQLRQGAIALLATGG